MANHAQFDFTVSASICRALNAEKVNDGFKDSHVAKHIFPENSSVCLKGRLDRLLQIYVGIQKLANLYGGTSKIVIKDVLFNTTITGQVPSKFVLNPLIYRNRAIQEESKAKIPITPLNDRFHSVTIKGHLWQCEKALDLIKTAMNEVENKTKKSKKRSPNQVVILNKQYFK